MKERHLLRAADNPRRLIANLEHLVSKKSVRALEAELQGNVRGLFVLGEEHFNFARRLKPASWRQRVSRLYYAGYNIIRSVRLCYDGHYSQEASDHRRFDRIPADFPNREKYAQNLALLRADRNLCDYDHTVSISDLVEAPSDWTTLVSELLEDAKYYLEGRGVKL